MSKEEKKEEPALEGAEALQPAQEFMGALLQLTGQLQGTLDRMEEVIGMQRSELDKVHARLKVLEDKAGIKAPE